MYALTLTPLWAWLVIHGPKDVENRTWVNQIIRGLIERQEPFLVHTSRECTRKAYDEALKGRDDFAPELSVPERGELVCGAIIGSVLPVGIIEPVAKPTATWHLRGQYGYLLSERKPLRDQAVMSATGKLGFWKTGLVPKAYL